MLWILLSLSAYSLWALTNLGDKYVVGERITNTYVYTILGYLIGGLCLAIIPFVNFYIPSWDILCWLFFGSIGFFLGTFFYLKALANEEVTRITILFNFLGIFTLVFAWLFIEDKLNTYQLLAFVLFLLGSIFASLHFKMGKFKITRALPLMLVACCLYAGHDVVNRYLTMSGKISYSLAFVYLTIFVTLFSFLLFFSSNFRNSWKKNLQGILSWKLLFFIILIMIFSRLGVLLQLKAFSLGPVALINALIGFQTILVFILAGLISWLAPKYIKEDWDKKNLLLKLLALLFMLAGVVVLNWW